MILENLVSWLGFWGWARSKSRGAPGKKSCSFPPASSVGAFEDGGLLAYICAFRNKMLGLILIPNRQIWNFSAQVFALNIHLSKKTQRFGVFVFIPASVSETDNALKKAFSLTCSFKYQHCILVIWPFISQTVNFSDIPLTLMWTTVIGVCQELWTRFSCKVVCHFQPLYKAK